MSDQTFSASLLFGVMGCLAVGMFYAHGSVQKGLMYVVTLFLVVAFGGSLRR